MRTVIKFFKKWLPPGLTNFVLNNLGYLGLAPWKYSPKGFNNVSEPIMDGGWNSEVIAKFQVDNWSQYSALVNSTMPLAINHEAPILDNKDPFFHNLLLTFSYVLALSAASKKSINFLDWGGGIGHYGVLAKSVLNPADIQVNYYCYDFEVFGLLGKTINPNYYYFHKDNQHRDIRFDLIMASSSVWYEPDWKLGIKKIIGYHTRFLYITRMIFINSKMSFVARQKLKRDGFETEYLFWILNKREFIDFMLEMGYNLIREFEFGESIPIFKAPEQGTIKGFLFKKL